MSNMNISKQRIMGEFKKLKAQKLANLVAEPLQDNLYDWHFTILGPQNTQFHEGIYHGQILLPYQYPFKPPDIVFMNKNGRFQTNTKICLTITQYHPEQWNSAWTIRTMLQAVISLFSQNIQGVGSLTATADIRASLAKNSHQFTCQKCGIISNILKPRPPRIQTKNFPFKVPQIKSQNFKPKENQQQISIQRIFSQDPKINRFYQPQLNKIYSTSKNPSNIIKQQKSSLFSKKSKHLSTTPIQKYPVLQHSLKTQVLKQQNRGQNQQNQVIYVDIKNNLNPSNSGLKALIKKRTHLFNIVEHNSSKLQRVYNSVRWVQ